MHCNLKSALFSFIIIFTTSAAHKTLNTTLNATTSPATTSKAPINTNSTVNGISEALEEDDYDYDDENARTKQSRQRNKNIITRVGITYAWDRWEKWSKCTTLCVQIRRRKCIERIQNDTLSDPVERYFYPDAGRSGAPGCHGLLTRYRICKDERCKSGNQLISQQQLRDTECNANETTSLPGNRDTWLGHVVDHNECELYCRLATASERSTTTTTTTRTTAVLNNETIIRSLERSVIDGTLCQRPSIYYTNQYRGRAICVEGICKAVHSSGAIRPSTTNDSQQKCGSVLCSKVSEIFSKAKLTSGYNYVANIPIGAMNLTVKQLSRSDNLLALKTTEDVFLINGNNRSSDSGLFVYEDNTYDYNKELGIITAKGPLNKAVVLMVLFVRGLNTGVKYDYVLPVPSASLPEDEESPTQWNELGQPLDEIEENSVDGSPISTQIQRQRQRNRRKFSWKLLGFGECNRSCGPGVQPPIFRCIREPVVNRYYTPKRCAFVEKPVFSENIYHCNKGLCAAYWKAGDYSECKCNEDKGVEGVRTRYVKCVQEQITGQVEEVAESQCRQEKLPELTETCNCPKANRRKIYARAPDKAPKVYARLIGGPPSVIRATYNSSSPPLRRYLRDDRTDKTGVWLMSEWSQEECAENGCGEGYEHRTIYCDRTLPYSDLCDLRYTPEQKRVCGGSRRPHQTKECRRGVWFASEWGNCTGDCFNLQRKRAVLCLSGGIVVDDKVCAESGLRPSDTSNCTHKEVEYCSPKWHYSEWSECSRSCGEGIQRRYAKCLEFDWKQNAMIESNNCKYLDREPVYGACNAQKCEELHIPLEEAIKDAPTTQNECTDDFSNCKRINRQRLCKLQYYRTYCCLTCNGL